MTRRGSFGGFVLFLLFAAATACAGAPASCTTLRVRTAYRDYVTWLTQAEAQQISMVQSHLVVDNGEPVVDRNAQDRLSRRAVFVTPGGGLHLYDSGARQETLWDAAEFLRNNYRAVAALNLETGPFGVVATVGRGTLTWRSRPNQPVVPSSLLVIDFD